MIDEIDLAFVIADHADLARLCRALEHVADVLPGRLADETIQIICFDLERRGPAQQTRLSDFLDALFGQDATRSSCGAGLNHIRIRSVSHVVLAQELAAALRSRRASPSVDTLGYMLRGFFEGCRSAMAFEELAILQFAVGRLTGPARALLNASFEARCAP